MTYANIILPYDYVKSKVINNSITLQKMKGSFLTALKNGGNAVKNAIQNPTETINTLAKYMTDESPTAKEQRTILKNKIVNGISTFEEVQNTIVNKFSGIAVTQLLTSGKVTNQDALDYLFLGFAPALGKQAVAMGYSGLTQMKDALLKGSVNIGSFVSGFSKTLKSVTDYTNNQKNKENQNTKRVIELDVTFSFTKQYQSESPDRRVENGISYQEVLHNLPETFSLECGLQDGRRYTVDEFTAILEQLRETKQTFKLQVGNESIENVVLQSFSPIVSDSYNGFNYSLELKKILVGSVELTPITIQPLDVSLYKQQEKNSVTSGITSSDNVNIPNIVNNNATDNMKLTSNKNQSLLAKYNGNAIKAARSILTGG